MRTEFILSEVGIGLRRNLTMTIASVVVVTVTLALLGFTLIFQHGASTTKKAFLGQIEVSVFLDMPCGSPGAGTNCVTPAERTQIQQTLQQLPQVESVSFVTQAEAYQRFKETSDSPDLAKLITASKLPESFDVKLKNPQQFAVVQSAVGSAPGVSGINDGRHYLEVLFSFFNRVTVVVLVVGLLALLATVLLIYNAMRVAAFTRRRETSIMRLVGASNLSIQLPFVLEGTLIGLLGSALAVGFLLLLRQVLFSTLHFALLRHFGEWSTLAWSLPWVIAVGILLPSIASFVTLQRHLRV